MILDANDVENGACVTADVCVVGAGAAGIAIALSLLDSGVDVLVLESGGWRIAGKLSRCTRARSKTRRCTARQTGIASGGWGLDHYLGGTLHAVRSHRFRGPGL